MIISDSHAMNKTELLSLLNRNKVDYYIHCGDIYPSYDGLPLNNFYLVKGNNDFSKIPTELNVTLDNKKFFITHGHLNYVEYDINELVEHAKKYDAQVICYGHTHCPYLRTIDNILVINPGSAFFPRSSYRKPTFCILDTNTLKVDFYDVDTNQKCNPFIKTKHTSIFNRLFK